MLKTWKSLMLASTLAAGLTFVAAGCAPKSAAPGGDSAQSGNQKEYVVGTDASYAPFESVDSKTQQVVGFDIDVVKAIAEKEGMKVKFVNTPWDGIFAALNNGERDFLVSAITITDERKKTMDFSDKYFEATQMIVSKDGSVKTLNDLKGKKIGVQNGTTGDTIVTDFLGKDYKGIKRYDSMPLALEALKNGDVDVAVGDNGVVIDYVKNNKADNLHTAIDPKFPKEYYGLAVKKGNTELLNKLNDGIKKINEDGTYKKIYDKYFGQQ
ncbi:basic amino acid ABC transporter substrate-binding protein [Collibacillus ludicampi]|uniref:Basic amino acid ABC transporter substrate-binding protein n=1 Tax=Collibacillus ludicampi TaxID=2771369 RepID=A0AAV4LCG1_9BACL|nr:basic amino acid ABC transporter substrate-binding protein [Collibacillus ludicampi]